MNRLQISSKPIEANLGVRLSDLITDVWNDPLVGVKLPDPRFHASIRFLLGCELAFRFGQQSSLGLVDGLADPEVSRECVSKIEAVLRPWELCASEPGFNAILSLTHTWWQLLDAGFDPEEVVRAAFAVPFQVNGIDRLKGFVERCLAQYEKFGDMFMSGFVKVHRWFDEACPNGPDPRIDALSVILSSPYSGQPCERSFIAAVLASRPEKPAPARCRNYPDYLLETYDWARRFPERFPEAHAHLIDEIEADSDGPGMGLLIRIYRHWFGGSNPSEWRSGMLETLSRYVPTVVAGEKTLTPWSLEPSALKCAVDFAAWAGITAVWMET